jgi:hypothetical protein
MKPDVKIDLGDEDVVKRRPVYNQDFRHAHRMKQMRNCLFSCFVGLLVRIDVRCGSHFLFLSPVALVVLQLVKFSKTIRFGTIGKSSGRICFDRVQEGHG